MTDRQMLDLLVNFYQVQKHVVIYMMEAMYMFEQGKDESCWYCLLRWCEARDERDAYWDEFKHHYPDAIALKEGVSYEA
jgi:hypothetical protein